MDGMRTDRELHESKLYRLGCMSQVYSATNGGSVPNVEYSRCKGDGVKKCMYVGNVKTVDVRRDW